MYAEFNLSYNSTKQLCKTVKQILLFKQNIQQLWTVSQTMQCLNRPLKHLQCLQSKKKILINEYESLLTA